MDDSKTFDFLNDTSEDRYLFAAMKMHISKELVDAPGDDRVNEINDLIHEYKDNYPPDTSYDVLLKYEYDFWVEWYEIHDAYDEIEFLSI